jgi:hypothetical protein
VSEPGPVETAFAEDDVGTTARAKGEAIKPTITREAVTAPVRTNFIDVCGTYYFVV